MWTVEMIKLLIMFGGLVFVLALAGTFFNDWLESRIRRNLWEANYQRAYIAKFGKLPAHIKKVC